MSARSKQLNALLRPIRVRLDKTSEYGRQWHDKYTNKNWSLGRLKQSARFDELYHKLDAQAVVGWRIENGNVLVIHPSMQYEGELCAYEERADFLEEL